MDSMNTKEQELTDRSLEAGYWRATHRSQLQRLRLGVIIGIAVGIWAVTLYLLVDWVIHIPQQNAVRDSIITQQLNYNASSAAEDVRIARTVAVIRDFDSVDALAVLDNPNENWGAQELEYEVIIGGSSAGREVTTLAPGQQRFVTKTNIPYSGSGAPTVEVLIHRTDWQKTPQASLPNEAWEVRNQEFSNITSSQDITFQSQLSLDLYNGSVYGYRPVEVVVVLSDANGKVQAIGNSTIDKIGGLDEKSVVMKWPAQLSSTLEAEVQIHVDKMDPNAVISTVR